jgi:hypothetical protein
MYNPYTILNTEILEAMLCQPMYFVRQYFKRGIRNEDDKNIIPLLFTHYIHHETDNERAARHMRLLWDDPYRFLYNSTNPIHAAKLSIAANQPEGYKIYINLLPHKWIADECLKKKINSFVLHKLSWWNYAPTDKLNMVLKERFGRLYIGLLWKGQQTEVDLEEIENFDLCVTT